jgi:hypothetical protein
MLLLLPLLLLSPAVDALKTKQPALSIPSTAMLEMRGGANFKVPIIPPKHMITVYSGFYAWNGAFFPAPEAADRSLIPDTDDYLAMLNLGAMSIGYALLVYMTAFACTIPIPKIVAFSSLPTAYVTYQNMLKGVTTTMTDSHLHGPITTASLVASIGAIIFLPDDKYNHYAVFLATFLGAQALITGLVGRVNPTLGRKLVGWNPGPVPSPKEKATFARHAALQVGWGALVIMILPLDMMALDAILRAVLLETLLILLDGIFWNPQVSNSNNNNYYYYYYARIAIPLATAVTIWIHR